jgi:hypothetical protein
MNEETNEKLRKFLVPGAASVIGAGAGLVLTKSDKLKDALPSLNGAGIGDLAEDLRSKIGSVTGGGSESDGGSQSTSQSSRSQSGSRRTLNANELEKRQRERQQRRKQRAGR